MLLSVRKIISTGQKAWKTGKISICFRKKNLLTFVLTCVTIGPSKTEFFSNFFAKGGYHAPGASFSASFLGFSPNKRFCRDRFFCPAGLCLCMRFLCRRGRRRFYQPCLGAADAHASVLGHVCCCPAHSLGGLFAYKNYAADQLVPFGVRPFVQPVSGRKSVRGSVF